MRLAVATALAGALVASTAAAPSSVVLPTKDAPYSVSASTLSHAVSCTRTPDGSRKVVLLVHGTALNAASWDATPYWRLLPTLQYTRGSKPAGIDVCRVDLPMRALVDAQTSAEYVAHAIQTLAPKSVDGKVAAIGHSQGGGLNVPWATIFWPSTRKLVSSFIGLAPDFHGTNLLVPAACLVENAASGLQGCATSFLQQDASSKYLAAQEAFLRAAIVPTTAVFTRTDEIVIPQFPDAIASSRLPGSAQFPLQDLDVCGPLHVADHLDMTIDPAAFAIAVQAINSASGVADKGAFDRAQCTNFNNVAFDPNDFVKPTLDYLSGLGLAVLTADGAYSKTEPALRKYVAAAGYRG